MKNRMFQGKLVRLLVVIALGTVGCNSLDISGRNKAIEDAIDQRYGSIQIQTGIVSIKGDQLAYFKSAESAGLVTLREIPLDYWSSFLTQTQNMGRPFEVTATPKLLAVVSVTPKPEDSPKDAPTFARVKIQEAKMGKIITEEEYNGPLATPGEKHRLILGLYKRIPTPAASVVGGVLAGQDEKPFRFRCVMKYSEFKKEWSVVAFDVGAVDPETWYTSNVK